MRKHPEQEVRAVRFDVLDGLPISTIARFHTIPESTIRRWIREQDWPHTSYRKTVTVATRTVILNAADTTSASQAARHFGVSRRTIARWQHKRKVVQRGETPRRWRCQCGTLVVGTTCPTCHFTAPWAQDAV